MTLLELLQLMRKHLKLVIALPVILAIGTAAYSWIILPDEYTATSSVYVLVKSDATNTQSVTNSELTASQMVTNDVATLMKSDRLKTAAAQSVGLADLSDYDISITSSTTSRVIQLSVTGTDPQTAAAVANAVVTSADSLAQSAMEVKSVNVIDKATAPTEPSGPNRLMYTAVALLAGLFLAIAIIVIKDMVDTRVRSAEEIEELTGLAVIGRIPKVK